MSEMTEAVLDGLSFPCMHVFKVIGPAEGDFVQRAFDAVSHVAPLTPDQVKTRSSRDGRYISVSFVVHLHQREQMVQTYQQLKSLPDVKFLL